MTFHNGIGFGSHVEHRQRQRQQQRQRQTCLRASTISTEDREVTAEHTTSSSSSSSLRWTDNLGYSAVRQVQALAGTVAKANTPRSIVDDEYSIRPETPPGPSSLPSRVFVTTDDAPSTTTVVAARKKKNGNNVGGTSAVYTTSDASRPGEMIVLSALENLERDMQLLDTLAGERPQLSVLEFTLLSLSIVAASSGPLFFHDSLRVAEVLAPAAAAFSASIGIGAEYVGKVAVADGKEIAAATIQCAAEAEAILANAERVKAVTPLCVGVGATAASFALLAPVLIDALNIGSNLQLVTEMYLLCPLVSVLAAAVASLALQETRSYTTRAIAIGNRRFAKSGLVGRTWLSSTELVERKSRGTSARWTSFAKSVLPAPLIGALVPGALPTKTIVVTALAAAQSALYLAQAEHTLARATDAVALKARSAAVCDTYANQGARSAAILPFTSALSGLCAAATAAIVELPWLESLAAMGGFGGIASQTLVISIFPTLSALFAAAASVSKARCEVDAEAATQAASTLALEYESGGPAEDDPVLRPFRGVMELIRLTASSGWKTMQKTRFTREFLKPLWHFLSRALMLKR